MFLLVRTAMETLALGAFSCAGEQRVPGDMQTLPEQWGPWGSTDPQVSSRDRLLSPRPDFSSGLENGYYSPHFPNVQRGKGSCLGPPESMRQQRM